MSPQTTNDPSILATDADNATPEMNAAVTEPGAPDPKETRRVQDWHRKIKMARAFDENVRKMIARDRRYARGQTGAEVAYSLIQAYIDILVAFLVARDPDLDVSPSQNVGQSGLADAEVYGKTMEIVVRHLLRSAKLRRRAERWVRSALSVGVGVLKATWQEVWGQDPHVKARLKDAQKNVEDIRVLFERIRSGEVDDMELAAAKLKDLQDGLANEAEVLIAAGMALDNIRPEDMVYSIDGESIVDTDEFSWLGNRYFIDKDDALSEFKTLTSALVQGATKYSPRKPEDRYDLENRKQGIVGSVQEDESDSFKKGSGGEAGTALFLCAWEIWDNNTSQFFTLIEGITDRYANPPQSPPCPTTKFDPYFVLTFTEVDGERHPQSLIARSAQLQDEVERAMSQFIEHRSRVRPKLGFDATKVHKDTIRRLKAGVTEEFVAIRMVAGANTDNSDMRRVLFPIAYSQIDPTLYSTEPPIRAMETVWGIQEALTSSVQVPKTATEADIQQAGTQAKTGYKRDVLEQKLTELAIYTGECAAYRLTLQEAQAIAGPEAFWIEFASPDDLHNMVNIEIRAGSTGKPNHAARREAWAAVQPQILQMMELIANLRQTPPPMLAQNLEELLIETAERMGDQLNGKRFIPQSPEMPLMGPDGRPLTNEQLMQQQQPAPGGQPPGRPGGGAGGGKPNGGATPPPQQPNGQEQLAPTTTPVAIAGP